VSDGNDDSPPATATVVISNQAPVADAGGPYSATRGALVAFDGTASSDADGDTLTYAWDFGDGTTGTGPAPSHAYTSLGSFAATLVVSDGNDDSPPATATVTISNQVPAADAGGPYSATRGALVAFDGTASSDADGDTLTYAWDFGDGTTGTGPTPSHAYTSLGSFAATLVVSDGNDDSPPATATVTISNQPPVADAGGPYTAVRGALVAFDGTASSDADGDTLTYAWNFGDGTTGTGVTPSHAYASPGTFTATLVVTDGNDESAPVTAVVSIADLPQVVSISPASGHVDGGTVVTLQGSGFGTLQGLGVVEFDGVPAASYASWSSSEIVCVAPPHVAGLVDVGVTNAEGVAVTVPAAFAYSSLPYFETFEVGGALPAEWTHAATNDFDWAVDLGGTPSTNTGPSVDHTLGNPSGHYVYTEASSPNYPSRTAELLSPTLSTDGASNLTLSFWYHMYGSAMGSLHVDVSVNGVWQDDVATPLAGDQGNEWKQASVDLSAYAGSSVQLRFRGITGSSYRGDMAIDDVRLVDAPPPPVLSMLSPPQGSAGGGTTVTLDGSHFGDVQGSGSVSFGGLPASSYVSWSDTQIVCTAPAHAPGDVDVTVSTNAGTQLVVPAALEYVEVVAAFPYVEDFEGPGPLPNGWRHDPSNDFDWQRDSGGTPSSGTGPSVDHSLGSATGNYLYTEASSPNYPSKLASLHSPLIDIDGLSQPELSFWTHMRGNAMGTLHVDLWAGDAWVEDVMAPLVGDQGNQWIEHTVDLSEYSGVVQVRFRMVTGSSYRGDAAIDDIRVEE
jgi:PKD repeat protein